MCKIIVRRTSDRQYFTAKDVGEEEEEEEVEPEP
jgi:hypothetical protein